MQTDDAINIAEATRGLALSLDQLIAGQTGLEGEQLHSAINSLTSGIIERTNELIAVLDPEQA